MKTLFFFLLLGIGFLTTGLTTKDATLKANDLLQLPGTWEGQLTYLDYSSGKPYSMPAHVNITTIKQNAAYGFAFIYPDEPKANSTDTILVDLKQQTIDGHAVQKVTRTDSLIWIETTHTSVDGNDNKPALIRHTYAIGKSKLSIRKDVQFTGTATWIQRHEYLFRRKVK
jgi:hypothetical protein